MNLVTTTSASRCCTIETIMTLLAGAAHAALRPYVAWAPFLLLLASERWKRRKRAEGPMPRFSIASLAAAGTTSLVFQAYALAHAARTERPGNFLSPLALRVAEATTAVNIFSWQMYARVTLALLALALAIAAASRGERLPAVAAVVFALITLSAASFHV